jgi:phosphoglycerate dehydrogenase-like enzyme
MAEHVVSFMLALARHLPGAVQDQQQRLWNVDRVTVENPNVELKGKTILVMGVGGIGSALARMCKAGFQMRVLGLSRTTSGDPHVDEYIDRSGLHGALAEADFVCLALPATPATDGIMDADAIAAMKSTAYLINVARGALIDEAALVDALNAGRIAGAALDVLTEEPASADSPFWDLRNVIITPHKSAITDRILGDSMEYYVENIRRFGEGEPLMGMVNKEAGY